MKFSVGGGTFTGGITPDLPYTVIGVMPAGFRFPFDNEFFRVRPGISLVPD